MMLNCQDLTMSPLIPTRLQRLRLEEIIESFFLRLCSSSRSLATSSFLSAFCDVVVSMAMVLLTLGSALMITIGFKTWCNDIMGRFPSCNDAAVNPIDKADGIQTAGFYVQMGTAQVRLDFLLVLVRLT
jgi:hypothetical protein